MTIYALLGTYDYEGRYLIGVYTTKEKALEAKAVFVAEEEWFDNFSIKKKVIDSKASVKKRIDAKAAFMQ